MDDGMVATVVDVCRSPTRSAGVLGSLHPTPSLSSAGGGRFHFWVAPCAAWSVAGRPGDGARSLPLTVGVLFVRVAAGRGLRRHGLQVHAGLRRGGRGAAGAGAAYIQ